MKRPSTITAFLSLFLIAIGTVHSQSLTEKEHKQVFQPYKSGVIAYHGYAFPVVPGTEEWKALGHQQRVASLQLPLDTLHSISTVRLLETCLYYPFNIDIFAFDDPMASFGRIKEQFNGYAELYQRPDYVHQLVSLYDSRDVSFVDQITLDYDKGLYSFDLCILEFMLADAAYLFPESQVSQIVSLLLEKMDQKTQNPVYGHTNRIVVGLAIGRCLQRINALGDYQGSTLMNFLQNIKLDNLSDLDYIINKAKSIKSSKP